MREGGLDGFSHLQYINVLSLWDTELVIVSIISLENIFGVDCWDGYTQKEGSEKLLWFKGKDC